MDDVGTEQPIDVQLEFETSTRDLGGGRANFASMDAISPGVPRRSMNCPFTAASTMESWN